LLIIKAHLKKKKQHLVFFGKMVEVDLKYLILAFKTAEFF